MTTTSLTAQYAPSYDIVDGTFTLRHGLRIDIHRALDGGVAEQLLLHFDVGEHLQELGRKHRITIMDEVALAFSQPSNASVRLRPI